MRCTPIKSTFDAGGILKKIVKNNKYKTCETSYKTHTSEDDQTTKEEVKIEEKNNITVKLPFPSFVKDHS